MMGVRATPALRMVHGGCRGCSGGRYNGGRGGIGGGGGFGRRELELKIDGTIKGATDEVNEVKEELAELGVLVMRYAGLGKWREV